MLRARRAAAPRLDLCRHREGEGARARPIGLSPQTTDELLSLALLSPPFVCKLDTALSKQCFASDATLSHGSVVVADVDVSERVMLWSKAPRRSERTHIFPATVQQLVATVAAETARPQTDVNP